MRLTALSLVLALSTLVACGSDADGDGYPEGVDCDDANADVHPGADEMCDGVDNDCSGFVDDRPIDGRTFYDDDDSDGFGDITAFIVACEAPAGTADNGDDCDDSDAAFNPDALEEDCSDPNDYNCDGSVGFADGDGDGFPACNDCDDADEDIRPDAIEICDGEDNDCDTLVDDADDSLAAQTGSTFYTDADEDGFGDLNAPVQACELPAGAAANADDCNDTTDAIKPGADELCDEIDNNCDGVTDEDTAVDAPVWYADYDGDMVGGMVTMQACAQPGGFVDTEGDCDDLNADRYPGNPEVCDGLDNDCNTAVDDEDSGLDTSTASTWFADTDQDGAGDELNTTAACAQPEGYVANDLDCHDDDDKRIDCTCGSGADGNFTAPKGDSTLEGGTYEYGSFVVPSGSTLRVSGDKPLVIVADFIDVSGTVDASGGDGSDSGPEGGPSGGDAVGGGGGGGGGGDCGNGPGNGGLPNGASPAEGRSDGGAGGLAASVEVDAATGGGFGPGGGGGGGGASAAGSNGRSSSGSAGLGGASFSAANMESVFTGGGGGAGGGANGGGGGAGGGAVALFGAIVEVSGVVDARGGDGGGKTTGSCTSGGGGGGGGGMIWVHGYDVEVTGSLLADAGTGKVADSSVRLDQFGGDGADGRVRISGRSSDSSGASVSPAAFSNSDDPDCARW